MATSHCWHVFAGHRIQFWQLLATTLLQQLPRAVPTLGGAGGVVVRLATLPAAALAGVGSPREPAAAVAVTLPEDAWKVAIWIHS